MTKQALKREGVSMGNCLDSQDYGSEHAGDEDMVSDEFWSLRQANGVSYLLVEVDVSYGGDRASITEAKGPMNSDPSAWSCRQLRHLVAAFLGAGCALEVRDRFALTDGDEPVLGAVYQPQVDELWLGGLDAPTTRNGEPLPPLADRALAEVSIASYLHPTTLPDDSVRVPLLRAIQGAATVRMLGSGSIELAAVAAGRLGAWVQINSAPWDWLPGTAMIRAAGGVPVLAHPRSPGYEIPYEAIEGLAEAGLGGIEVFHFDHDAAERAGGAEKVMATPVRMAIVIVEEQPTKAAAVFM